MDVFDSWAVPAESTTWMDGTFVPEYVHIRGYYDLIVLKNLHKLRAVLVQAVEKNLRFFWSTLLL